MTSDPPDTRKSLVGPEPDPLVSLEGKLLVQLAERDTQIDELREEVRRRPAASSSPPSSGQVRGLAAVIRELGKTLGPAGLVGLAAVVWGAREQTDARAIDRALEGRVEAAERRLAEFEQARVLERQGDALRWRLVAAGLCRAGIRYRGLDCALLEWETPPLPRPPGEPPYRSREEWPPEKFEP